MEVRTGRALRRIALDPGLAFGEGYMDGEIAPVGCGVYELLDVLVLNLEESGGAHTVGLLMEWVRRAKRRLDQLNPAARARRNAARHYDLDRRLFSLFLDRDLQYSCAYFPTGGGGRWKRRRRSNSATSRPSCASTGRGWRCWRSVAAGAAWR